jgi:REP element-mobilizing transposase RayT
MDSMIIAHHLMCTAYGWWLPNDPRGSMSMDMRVEPVAELGAVHYGRKQVQPHAEELRRFHQEAGDVLKHQIRVFDDEETALLGTTIEQWIIDNNYTCYACALMPDHVHLLIRRHRDPAETMLEKFQTATRSAIVAAGHRSPTHPVWGGKGWKVFQNSVEQVRRTIRYVENNPLKAGRPRQYWPFVKPYDGWMPRIPG